MAEPVVNVIVVGLGGQGVVRASDILADAAFRAGYDVKKSEIRGMSQRGGAVRSDVRFGGRVLSPMTPDGEADYVLALDPGQADAARGWLRPGGVLIGRERIDSARLLHPKALNVALLGALSARLDIPAEHWTAALRAHLPASALEANRAAFQLGSEGDGTLSAPRGG